MAEVLKPLIRWNYSDKAKLEACPNQN